MWCYIHQTTTIKASQSAWIVIIQYFTIKPNTHTIQTLKSFLPIFLQVQAASRGELLSSRSSNIVGTTTTSSTLSSTTYNFLLEPAHSICRKTSYKSVYKLLYFLFLLFLCFVILFRIVSNKLII